MSNRILALAWLAALTVALPAFAEKPKHFDAKGKPPSEYTIRGQQALRKTLPLDDERDFAESKKGFIAAPESRQIENAKGEVVWDIGAFDFLLEDGEFDSIHPSLQRQALLNMAYGLFEVVPGHIYQVRGFDLASNPDALESWSVVSVGVFDGVHLGHQRLLHERLDPLELPHIHLRGRPPDYTRASGAPDPARKSAMLDPGTVCR